MTERPQVGQVWLWRDPYDVLPERVLWVYAAADFLPRHFYVYDLSNLRDLRPFTFAAWELELCERIA